MNLDMTSFLITKTLSLATNQTRGETNKKHHEGNLVES